MKILTWLANYLITRVKPFEKLSPEDELNLGLLYEEDFYTSLKRLLENDKSNLQVAAIKSQNMRELDFVKGQYYALARLETRLKNYNTAMRKKEKE